MNKSDFTLFFSLPLDETDWQNLAASQVKRVMLPFSVATPDTLSRFAQMGLRVVLRVEEGSYGDPSAGGRIAQGVIAARSHAVIDAVIIGTEPDAGPDWTFGSRNWGQERAFAHRSAFDRVRHALQFARIRAISPGWTTRSVTEDDPPQPGRTSWREIMSGPEILQDGTRSFGYQDADGCGVHFYQYRLVSAVDELRFKFYLKEQAELWHKPLWIDEVNIDNGDPLTRMRACIAMADMLVSGPFATGPRVAMFCPFVSNGDAHGWSPGYLMRDPACYTELGAWLRN